MKSRIKPINPINIANRLVPKKPTQNTNSPTPQYPASQQSNQIKLLEKSQSCRSTLTVNVSEKQFRSSEIMENGNEIHQNRKLQNQISYRSTPDSSKNSVSINKQSTSKIALSPPSILSDKSSPQLHQQTYPSPTKNPLQKIQGKFSTFPIVTQLQHSQNQPSPTIHKHKNGLISSQKLQQIKQQQSQQSAKNQLRCKQQQSPRTTHYIKQIVEYTGNNDDLKQIHKDIKIKDKILLEKVKEIDALKTANRTIEQNLTFKQQQINRLQIKLNQLSDLNAILTAESTSNKQQIATLTSQLRNISNNKEKQEQDYARKVQQSKRYQEDNQKLNSYYRGVVKEYEGRLMESQKIRQRLEEKLKLLQDNYTEMENILSEEILAQKSKVSSTYNLFQTQQKRYKNLEINFLAIKTKSQQQATRISQLTEFLNNSKTTITQKQQQIETLRNHNQNQSRSYEQAQQSANKSLKSLTQTLYTSQQTERELRKRLSVVDQQLQQKQQIIKKLQIKISQQLQQQLQKVKVSNKQLTTTLHLNEISKQQQIKLQQKKFNEDINELLRRINNYLLKIRCLESEKQGLTLELDEYRRMGDDREQLLGILQHKIDELEGKQINGLKVKLGVSEGEVTALTTKLSTLQQNNSELFNKYQNIMNRVTAQQLNHTKQTQSINKKHQIQQQQLLSQIYTLKKQSTKLIADQKQLMTTIDTLTSQKQRLMTQLQRVNEDSMKELQEEIVGSTEQSMAIGIDIQTQFPFPELSEEYREVNNPTKQPAQLIVIEAFNIQISLTLPKQLSIKNKEQSQGKQNGNDNGNDNKEQGCQTSINQGNYQQVEKKEQGAQYQLLQELRGSSQKPESEKSEQIQKQFSQYFEQSQQQASSQQAKQRQSQQRQDYQQQDYQSFQQFDKEFQPENKQIDRSPQLDNGTDSFEDDIDDEINQQQEQQVHLTINSTHQNPFQLTYRTYSSSQYPDDAILQQQQQLRDRLRKSLKKSQQFHARNSSRDWNQQLSQKQYIIEQLSQCIQSYKQLINSLRNKIQEQQTIVQNYKEIMIMFSPEQYEHESLLISINQFVAKTRILMEHNHQLESRIGELQEEKQQQLDHKILLIQQIKKCEEIMEELEMSNEELEAKIGEEVMEKDRLEGVIEAMVENYGVVCQEKIRLELRQLNNKRSKNDEEQLYQLKSQCLEQKVDYQSINSECPSKQDKDENPQQNPIGIADKNLQYNPNPDTTADPQPPIQHQIQQYIQNLISKLEQQSP